MNKKNIALALVALSLSFGLGYFATPSKIKTKEVIKTVTVKEEAKTKIVYKEKVTNKDGTITEKEVSREDTNTKESTASSRTNESTVTKDAGLTLSALAIVSVDDIKGKREYALHASKRVLGAFSVNGMVTTDKKVGLGIGWSF